MYNFFVDNYETMSNSDIVLQIQSGNNEFLPALFKRYSGIIHKKAEEWYAAGFDGDDFAQEGYIALYHAAQTYDFSSSTFSTYANICIDRAVKSIVKRMLRHRRIPDNLISSLSDMEIPSSDNPEGTVIERETVGALFERIKAVLSDYEYMVFINYLLYYDYDKIAVRLNVPVKSVNNALCRIRRKIKVQLASNR